MKESDFVRIVRIMVCEYHNKTEQCQAKETSSGPLLELVCDNCDLLCAFKAIPRGGDVARLARMKKIVIIPIRCEKSPQSRRNSC